MGFFWNYLVLSVWIAIKRICVKTNAEDHAEKQQWKKMFILFILGIIMEKDPIRRWIQVFESFFLLISQKKTLDQSLFPKSIILWIIHQKSQGKSSLNFMGQFQISKKAESSSLLVYKNIGRSCNCLLWFFWGKCPDY